ncbi:MAG: tetratricopeptide repeat protein [Candidatus Marinimicrobia bacterium]|nr:tetratricopeptide repeat protein [Candidatus Neomarinimicrobiota bacterium]
MLHKLLIRLLVLLIMLSGAPIESNGLFAQDPPKKQSSTKKRPVRKRPPANSKDSEKKTQKRTSTSKKPTTSKKRPPRTKSAQTKKPTTKKTATNTRKKRPTTTKKKPVRKATTRPTKSSSKRSVKPTAARVVPPPVNINKLATDIYSLTDELSATNRQMNIAIANMEQLPKRQLVRLESKPVVSLAELERKAQSQPENLKLQHQLAQNYRIKGDLLAAKDIYLRMVYQNPRDADSHYYLGAFYAALNQTHKARQAFTEALLLNSSHQATLDGIAAIPGISNELVSSRPNRQNLAADQPDEPARLLRQIRIELDEGNYQSALVKVLAAQKKYPRQSGFAYLAGQTYEQLSDFESAKIAYQQATSLNHDNIDAYMASAKLLYDQGNFLYAALSCAQVIRLNPLSQEFRHLQGLAYFQAGEWGHAAAAWEDLLYYAPKHKEVRYYLPQVYYVLAMEYNRLGESALGRTAFNKAVNINTNTFTWLPGALTTLGKHYRELELYKQSLAAFQEVIELQPKEASPYTEIGITYWKMNEKRLARAAWQRSLELNAINNTAQGWLIISRQSG